MYVMHTAVDSVHAGRGQWMYFGSTLFTCENIVFEKRNLADFAKCAKLKGFQNAIDLQGAVFELGHRIC